MRMYYLSLVASAAFAGVALAQEPRTLSSLDAGQHVRATLEGGKATVQGDLARISADSLMLVVKRRQEVHSLAFGQEVHTLAWGQVSKLEVPAGTSHPRGAANGAKVGAVVGGVLGVFLGVIVTSCDDSFLCPSNKTSAALGVFGATTLVGAAAGGAIGLMVGARTWAEVELPFRAKPVVSVVFRHSLKF